MKCSRCKKPIERAATGRKRRYCSTRCRMAAWRKRRNLAINFSSGSCEWPTPACFFAEVSRRFGPFDLDPCATAENAKCPRYFTREDDGLAQVWTGRVFMNPPYGKTIADWMRKAWEASQTTAELVVCLVPANTDTAWWHDWAMRGEYELIRGRLKFGAADNSAPFRSALVVFRNAETVTKLATA